MGLLNATDWAKNLRALTTQAGQAAELGRWDQVEEYYERREKLILDYPMPTALAMDLAGVDRGVTTRIVNVQLAVQSQLIEITKIRQNLQGIRSWQGLSEVKDPLMDRQA